MRTTISVYAVTAALFAAVTPTNARSADTNDKPCIFSAAQKLPVVPGLAITASRTEDMPRAASDPKDVSHKFVEIDVRAAGRDATFKFVCSIAKGGMVASPMGISK